MSTAPSPEQAMQFMADAVLYQRIDLTGPWVGWKIRGQYLVSPENERIMMRELLGMLIHYRRTFGHQRRAPQPAAAQASNVVPLTRAASIAPSKRQKVA